jgi:hypothetical protein
MSLKLEGWLLMSDLPTKPGSYYWREKDGDEWELWHVLDNGSELTAHRGFNVAFLPDLGGQWLPVPAAEELVELQAKANAYDDGQKLWVSFDVETGEPYAIDRDPAITIHDTWKLLGRHPQGNMPGGFVNSKVRVCKEVENEKGKE